MYTPLSASIHKFHARVFPLRHTDFPFPVYPHTYEQTVSTQAIFCSRTRPKQSMCFGSTYCRLTHICAPIPLRAVAKAPYWSGCRSIILGTPKRLSSPLISSILPASTNGAIAICSCSTVYDCATWLVDWLPTAEPLQQNALRSLLQQVVAQVLAQSVQEQQ